MIDQAFQTVQSMLNKEQLGYLAPIDYNLFAKRAQRNLYNKYLNDLKLTVRKKNWMLDGKDFADASEHLQQYIEHYSFEANISPESPGYYIFPDDMEFVEDIFNGNSRIEKINYSDLLLLRSNIYSSPSTCKAFCSKVGDKLRVLPIGIDPIEMHYLRKPKTPKWTFVEFEGNPMFAPDANDFQDIDMPEGAYDDLISLIFEYSSIHLRDFQATQAANAEQQQEINQENKE